MTCLYLHESHYLHSVSLHPPLCCLYFFLLWMCKAYQTLKSNSGGYKLQQRTHWHSTIAIARFHQRWSCFPEVWFGGLLSFQHQTPLGAQGRGRPSSQPTHPTWRGWRWRHVRRLRPLRPGPQNPHTTGAVLRHSAPRWWWWSSQPIRALGLIYSCSLSIDGTFKNIETESLRTERKKESNTGESWMSLPGGDVLEQDWLNASNTLM